MVLCPCLLAGLSLSVKIICFSYQYLINLQLDLHLKKNDMQYEK